MKRIVKNKVEEIMTDQELMGIIQTGLEERDVKKLEAIVSMITVFGVITRTDLDDNKLMCIFCGTGEIPSDELRAHRTGTEHLEELIKFIKENLRLNNQS